MRSVWKNLKVKEWVENAQGNSASKFCKMIFFLQDKRGTAIAFENTFAGNKNVIIYNIIFVNPK